MPRKPLPRIFALGLLCLSVSLVGAARPTPRPSPTPTPTPSATPEPPHALPLVVVFPFDASTDIKPGTGQAAAQLYVQQMNAAGGIDTIAAPASVKRTSYASYASGVKADYYLAGYMTPLGNGVSLVEQVVSVRSGTIVYGQTAQIESFQDATAQARMIHDGIIALEKQISDAYTSAQATSTSTPMPSNQANLAQGFSGLKTLFKHKGGPTPVPASAKPPKGVIVARVAGALPAADLAKATTELYTTLAAHYNARLVNSGSQNLTVQADSICGSDRNNTIAGGTATAKLVHHTLGSRPEYTFALTIYTCFGAKLAEATGTGGSLASAVHAAVESYAAAHPGNS